MVDLLQPSGQNLPDFTEHTLTSERLLDGKLIQVQRDQVRLPDGSESWREYVLHPGAVIIAAFVDEETLLFEHQYRYPVRRHFIELPAGKIDPDEPHADTAHRELREETGYIAEQMRHVATLHAGIGYSNDTIQLYIAQGLTQCGHERDIGEFLEVFTLPLSVAVEKVGTGEITDTKTAFSLLWLERFKHLWHKGTFGKPLPGHNP
ncbi:MAG: NUDIX hydrolase [Betaproteobacteria bacterium]|nr:NUDIX hydrolase [Betaproteobacteria bacterium]